MILTVLIGNTNTRLTWFRGRHIIKRWVRPTGATLPAVGRVDGAAIASVVPRRTTSIVTGLERQTGLTPLVVTPATGTGLRFRYSRRQLGADRVCAAVGARLRFSGDLVVLDFGTAVTLNVITADGSFIGGAIVPGADAMLETLSRATAQLPEFGFSPRRAALGRDTKSAMLSGITGLLSGGLESIIERLGPRCRVIATGGRAPAFRTLIRRIDVVDPDLAARGLAEIHRLNSPSQT